jgi:hypothetical protein
MQSLLHEQQHTSNITILISLIIVIVLARWRVMTAWVGDTAQS